MHVDHFGNLITGLSLAQTDAILANTGVQVAVAGVPVSAYAYNFADAPPDTPTMLRDSSGHLAMIVRDGSAAQLLHAGRGAEVQVRGLIG